MKKDRTLLILGAICLTYWILDFINIVFIIHKPEYLLWYSNAGLLLTSIALLRRSPLLISIMFCALFVLESIWIIDFLAQILLKKRILGITNYLFESTFNKKDFAMSMYHLLIPPSLLYAILKTKTINGYSWLGALMYALTISILTFFFVNQSENVNCVHQLDRCKGFFSFVFRAAPYPYHIFTSAFFATIFVFIPTNYILFKVANKYDWNKAY